MGVDMSVRWMSRFVREVKLSGLKVYSWTVDEVEPAGN